MLLISIFLLQPLAAFAQGKTVAKRNQLEELMIWKMSDELKLTATEEKTFSDIIKNLNLKKSDLNRSLQNSLLTLANTKDAKKREQEFAAYKKTLQAFNKVSEEELDKLKPLLGTERIVQYLQIKQDLATRIKATLTNPDAPMKDEKKPLPAPKVIIE
ncbi:hypothetical protein ACLVWU_15330 [Bdellovibrio sp. HCB290]|uniref:hypothetical protein n=1 Tax=Bdellovibrio sp. HCB290 TaxID=3394356 RepID=UPI0039B60F15